MLTTVLFSSPSSFSSLVIVTTIQPQLGKIMYADYKQVGMKVHSRWFLVVYNRYVA